MAKRILVVEDNDLNRKLFCDVLKSQGYAVEPCADGLEALDRARQFVPNLIIMDIQLPNVSGLDLIEAAKRDSTLRSISDMYPATSGIATTRQQVKMSEITSGLLRNACISEIHCMALPDQKR